MMFLKELFTAPPKSLLASLFFYVLRSPRLCFPPAVESFLVQLKIRLPKVKQFRGRILEKFSQSRCHSLVEQFVEQKGCR